MSNNVVSQQFQFYDPQMVQMEHVVGMSNSSTVGTPLQFSGHGSHNPVSFVSNENIGPVEPVSNMHGFQNLVVPINQMRPIEPKTASEGFREVGMKTMGISPQSSSVPAKRKAEMEPNANFSSPQELAVPKRRVVPTGTSPRLPSSQQPSALNRKPLQMHSKVTSPSSQNLSASNRRLARNDSSSGKSGSHQVQTPKGRTVQMESSKGQRESNDALRSKMRDNLAAALSLVCQNGEDAANAESNPVEQASDQQISTAAQNASSDLSGASAEEKKAPGFDNLQMQEPFPEGQSGTNKNVFGEPSITESTGTLNQSSKELRCSIFPEVDASFGDSFYVKDDLLQGNGLSWAMDLHIESSEFMGVHDTEKSELVEEGSGVVTIDKKRVSPEKLASEIEAELFKLFGGVNKKYKEKGRSLLFNLKDRSNPELRERVMSGEIPPDRLCAMTAEELASKELSEWRMAKAEELAQMVVLPDTDFSRRRLVKKTHKGEYQVDFEDETNVTTDAPAGTSVLSQSGPESKNAEVDPPKVGNANGKDTLVKENNKSEKKELSDSLVIPNDGTDLMHGMMVDELKDAEFLPPIISLDEFMESLDSEPPFEDLQVNASQSTQSSAKENSEAVGKSSPVSDSVAARKNSPVSDSVEDALTSKPDEMVVKHTEDVAPKPSESPVVQKNPPLDAASPRIEHIWAGTLQLSISSSVTTFGVFKSGEKTSTTEWASSLEIKGRVRLDAFEKFFKELPMSRTRAVMILHLVLKDVSSENERANLAEAVESYISDERLGFAEPASGVELYVCPPHEKMLDLLGNYVSEHRTEFLNSSENGLIGVVVWRKAPISSIISPKSSSHHKHSSKRQHVTSGRSQEKDANVNVKLTPKAPSQPAIHNHQLAARRLPPPPQPQEDDDSDIPPGFGPSSPREDDDLPEFNFGGNTKPTMARALPQTHAGLSAPSRPVDQIRQLIHKYGQNDPSVSPNVSNNRSFSDNQRSNIGLAMEPWDDDDDDMPEWQPNMPMPAHPSAHGLVRPLQPVFGSERFVQTEQRIDPRAVVPGSAPGWQHGRGRGRGQVPGNHMAGGGLASRMSMLQASQRRDGSRSRGF